MHSAQTYEAGITGQLEDNKFRDWLNYSDFLHRYFATILTVLGNSVIFPFPKAWHRLGRIHPRQQDSAAFFLHLCDTLNVQAAWLFGDLIGELVFFRQKDFFRFSGRTSFNL